MKNSTITENSIRVKALDMKGNQVGIYESISLAIRRLLLEVKKDNTKETKQLAKVN